MIHTNHDKVLNREESVEVSLNLIQESWSIKLCFSSRFVTLILCIEVDGM